MVANYTALTIYKIDAKAAAEDELDDLRTRMLLDLELFLASELTQPSQSPAGRSVTAAGRLLTSGVGRRVRA